MCEGLRDQLDADVGADCVHQGKYYAGVSGMILQGVEVEEARCEQITYFNNGDDSDLIAPTPPLEEVAVWLTIASAGGLCEAHRRAQEA